MSALGLFLPNLVRTSVSTFSLSRVARRFVCANNKVTVAQPATVGDFWPGTNLGGNELWNGSNAYLDMYPLKSKAGFRFSAKQSQAGWGGTIMNDRVEEDVGRFLAELWLGTTAVDID